MQEFLDKLGCAFVVGLFILDLFLQLVRKIRVDCSCKWVSDFINSCKNKRARYLLVPLLINRADSMANGRAMGTKRGATRGAAAAATVLRKTGRLNARIEVRSKWFIVESAKKQQTRKRRSLTAQGKVENAWSVTLANQQLMYEKDTTLIQLR